MSSTDSTRAALARRQQPASTEVAAANTNSSSLTDRMTYARALADASLLPKAYARQPANVLLAIEYGQMLGISPMAAVLGVHVIEGKPSVSAELVKALVRRAGHRIRVTGDDKSATCEIVRSDDPGFTYRSTWTMARAHAAEIDKKDVWKKYPPAMLKARAVTECARDACSDVLMGVAYTPEELGADYWDDAPAAPAILTDTQQDEHQDVVEAVVVDTATGEITADSTPVVTRLAGSLESATAMDDLSAAAASIGHALAEGTITDEDRGWLLDLYTARKDELTQASAS
ncbi:MAG: hypothetical protein ACYCV4_18935 [Dermatophilaceae bacterium]